MLDSDVYNTNFCHICDLELSSSTSQENYMKYKSSGNEDISDKIKVS